MTQTATIIGCGLIGGSIGLALRRRRPDWRIMVIDLPDNHLAIQNSGFPDAVGTMDDLATFLPESTLVILATPVDVILEHLTLIAPHLAKGTVVTDVGGTKTAIAQKAAAVLGDDVCFIGGHPIAGSENAGILAANPLLFKDRVYVLCPDANAPTHATLLLLDVIHDLLAIPLTMEPLEHDRMLAMISHMPHMLSIALVHAAFEEDSQHSMLERAVGRGFLDTTRIAASRFDTWKGVLATNQAEVEVALDRFESSLKTIREAMRSGELAEIWTNVSAKRRKMTPEHLPTKRNVDLRVLIDQHDEHILKALSDRMQTAKQIGQIKAERTMPVHDPDRERRLMASRVEWGKSLDLPKELIDELFAVIMKHSRNLQNKNS